MVIFYSAYDPFAITTRALKVLNDDCFGSIHVEQVAFFCKKTGPHILPSGQLQGHPAERGFESLILSVKTRFSPWVFE